jgi:hypothetical protein
VLLLRVMLEDTNKIFKLDMKFSFGEISCGLFYGTVNFVFFKLGSCMAISARGIQIHITALIRSSHTQEKLTPNISLLRSNSILPSQEHNVESLKERRIERFQIS